MTRISAARRWLTVTQATAILVVISTGVASAAAQAPAPGQARKTIRPPVAYVANSASNTVTPVNTVTNSPGAPISVGNGPVAVAVTPSGKTAYIANETDSTVTPINTATNKAGRAISSGEMLYPQDMAITPNGATAYVGDNGNDWVTPISTSTNKAGKPIDVGCLTTSIVVTPNSKTAYALCGLNSSVGQVVPIKVATGKLGAPVNIGGGYPAAMAVSPSGKTLYVTDSSADSVIPVSTSTNTAGPAITVGADPDAIAVTSGGTAYVVSGTAGTVTPINTADNQPGTAITVGPGASTIAVTPNGEGAFVLVTNPVTGGWSVVPVDLVTGTTGTPITPVYPQLYPKAMAITPNGATLYIVYYSGGANGVQAIGVKHDTYEASIAVGASPLAIGIAP